MTTRSLKLSEIVLAFKTSIPNKPNKNNTKAILITTEKYEDINLRFWCLSKGELIYFVDAVKIKTIQLGFALQRLNFQDCYNKFKFALLKAEDNYNEIPFQRH